MPNVKGLLSDPQFNALDAATQRQVLARVDPDFSSLDDRGYQDFRVKMGYMPSQDTMGTMPSSTAARFGNEIMRTVGSLPIFPTPKNLEAIGAFAKHPIDSIKSMVGEMNLDDPSKSSGLLGLPDTLYQRWQSGQQPEVLADLATMAAPAAEDVVGALGKGAQAIRSIPKVNPDVSFYQSAPFRTSVSDFLKMSKPLREDVRRVADVTGTKITDIPSAKRVVEAAKAENRAVLDQHLAPYRQQGVQIPGDKIADAQLNSIPISLKIEARSDPAAAQSLQQMAQTANAYRVPFTVDGLRKLAIETNADLNNFFHGAPDMQRATLAKNGGVAGLEARASAIRDIFQQQFGPDAAELQRRWGWLDDFDSALDAQHKTVLKSETPVSTAAKMQRLAGAPGKMFHGDVEGALQSPEGKTNSLLTRTFEQTQPGAPLPMPPASGMGPGGFPGAIPPYRQLGAAPTPMPGGQPPLGPFAHPAAPHQQVNAMRPALPAPAPGQPPVNVLPTGPVGTARPLPPAGTAAAGFDQPRPLMLPAPPTSAAPPVRLAPAPGEPLPAENLQWPTARVLGKTIADFQPPEVQ